MVLIN